ncbi:MAG: hypothetical protein QOF53_2603 [Nocardioidaceae bacterium]|nr:hypothetical protein [Nocardioidaceae bacterium]
MSVDVTARTDQTSDPARDPARDQGSPAAARGLPRHERRRLVRQDRIAAHLAELHHIELLLAEAATVVSAGWVQHGWFAVADERHGTRVLSAHDLDALETRPVTGACLVGAVVHAAGGPPSVQTQLVQRALDLTWHTLHEDSHRPVHWCPAPPVRDAHVRDLTRWNDHPKRTADQVATLLEDTARSAAAQATGARAAL